MLKEQTFNTAAVFINYVEGPPSGGPLVFLHGQGIRWQTWLAAIPAVSMRWHTYALDLRGHGRSGRVADGYRIVQHAQDVAEFLRAQVAEPAVLVGYSLGSIVSIQVAAEAPETVRAAVLVDPRLGFFRRRDTGHQTFAALQGLAGSERSVEELALALAEVLPKRDAASLRARAKTLSQVDPDTYAMMLDGRVFESFDPDAQLKRISAPVLLLQGDPSAGGSLEDRDVEQTAQLLPGCIRCAVPGSWTWDTH